MRRIACIWTTVAGYLLRKAADLGRRNRWIEAGESYERALAQG